MPVVEFPNEFTIGLNQPRRELRKFGKCIYCGASEFIPGTGRPLGEEHFVPEGLGSRLVLLEASCERCAKKSGAIEQMVLRRSLLTPRDRLGIRRKKRSRSAISYPVHISGPDQKDIISHTSLDEHPSVLFLPYFNPPFHGAFLQTLTTLRKPTYPEFASPPIDTAAFCQLLAKIAHGVRGFRIRHGRLH